MNQVAFIPSGCIQSPACGVVCTTKYLCYASTISLYMYANSEPEGYPLLRLLTGPQCSLSSFSMNDEVVACVTPGDRMVYLWTATTGEAYNNLPTGMFGDLTTFVVSVNPGAYPSRIVFGCNEGRVVIWDIKDGKSFTLSISSASRSLITCIQWSVKAPQVFAVGTENGVVALVDSISHRIIFETDCFDSLRPSKESFLDRVLLDSPRVSCLAFDPLGPNYLLVGSTRGFLVMLDAENGSVVQTFDPSTVPFAQSAFVAQQPGCFITTDGTSSGIQFWNVSLRHSLNTLLPKPSIGVKSFGVLPAASCSQATVFVGYRDGSVSLFNLDTNRIGVMDTVPGHCETVFDCRFSTHDPDTMSSCSYDGTIRIWSVKTMTLKLIIETRKAVYCVDWSPNGDMIVAGMTGGEVAMYATSNGKELWRKKILDDVVWRVSWSQCAAGLLAVGSRDGTACVLAAQDGSLLRSYRHATSVFGVDFDPVGGKVLAVACYDGKARLYHLESNRANPLAVLVGHSAEVSQIVFNRSLPDVLATSGNDNTIRVWKLPQTVTALYNVATLAPNVSADPVFLQPVLTLSGHTDKTRGLCWNSLCPYLLLSGSWDSTVRIWDTRSGACLHTSRAHAGDVYSISSHRERPTIVVTASRDTTIRFWYLGLLEQLHLDAAFGLLRESLVNVNTIGVGENQPADKSVQFPCCGVAVEKLLAVLDVEQQPHQRLKRITDFFDLPYGGADIVSCASFRSTKDLSLIDPNVTVAPTDHLASVSITTANAKLESLKSRSSTAQSTTRREAEQKSLAMEYLRLGDTRKYCELMIDAKQLDCAIAAAPAVSLEYWKQMCIRAVDTLLEQGQYQRAVDLLVVCGESHRAADILASNGHFPEAVVIVQSCNQLSSTPPAVVWPASVDARQAFSKVQSFAKAFAAKFMKDGNPLLACASLIAADSVDLAVEVVLRSACIPVGHLLFHTLPVPQSLIDFGFTQSLLMSAANRRWRTAVVCLERLSVPNRIAAAADTLAMIVSEPNYSSASRYEVEKALEPYFQGSQHACMTTAAFAVSLWNCATQGDAASQNAHNEQILNRCVNELRAVVGQLIPIVAANEPIPAQAITTLELCRRWIHFTVHTENSALKAKQQTLFLAFLCAALLAKFGFSYEHLTASAFTLAAMFVEVEPSNTQLLQSARTAAKGLSPTASVVRCMPLGAKLPYHSGGNNRKLKSPLTNASPKGPAILLEDDETLVSLQEALEWHQCCWFSPLATGRRLLPF